MDGRGGVDGVGGGRGNLRENREDPAPTVGRLRGWHCDPNGVPLPPRGFYHAVWLGRALATLGTAPAKSAMANRGD